MDINDIKNHINNKSRLIGVDMGSKRVGLSISDENRKIATPLKTINYENIQIFINELDKIIKNKGRILVRKSGTEPKIRIMSESEDSNLNKLCINIIKKSIQ